MTTQSKTQHKIVIAGGGFAGARAALKLNVAGYKVTLISSGDHFVYFPQLYHIATGGTREVAAVPLEEIFEGTNVEVVADKADKLDADKKVLTTASGKDFHFDKLVLALGSVTTYFGIKDMQEHSFDIKSIAGSEGFKQFLHRQLVENKQPDGNYVVIGAGPTGTELSAALVSYLERITKLHGIKNAKYKVLLVEAAPRILPRSPESVAQKVQPRLEKLGVKVMTGQMVESAAADHLMVSGQRIDTKTVVWTAGIANNPFYKANLEQFTLNKRGFVEVDDHLQGRPDVYVIGDNGAIQYAGMAQSALSHAGYVARDIDRALSGKSRPAYKPHEAISCIPVGDNWAVAQWGRFATYGIPASLLRRAADLVGFHDILSPTKALRTWSAEYGRQDICPICDAAESASPAIAESEVSK